jgi:hypothetical protein
MKASALQHQQNQKAETNGLPGHRARRNWNVIAPAWQGDIAENTTLKAKATFQGGNVCPSGTQEKNSA